MTGLSESSRTDLLRIERALAWCEAGRCEQCPLLDVGEASPIQDVTTPEDFRYRSAFCRGWMAARIGIVCYELGVK